MQVSNIEIRKIFTSLGHQTIEGIINKKYISSSPVGSSRSKYEARAINPEKALNNFKSLKRQFMGDFNRKNFDAKLKSYMNSLGSQTTAALSLAFFSANPNKGVFPYILANVLGGGAHTPSGSRAPQEILVLAKEKSISDIIETNFAIWHEVGQELVKKRMFFALTYEAAWTADIDVDAALGIVADIAKKYNARVGVDLAASHTPEEEKLDWVLRLIKDYKLFYVEDPFEQDDSESFRELNKKTKAIICGDDNIATNLERLKSIKDGVKAVIVKPNQAGTVSGCLEVIDFANKNKITPVVSHRSGETDSDSQALCKLAQLVPMAKFGAAGGRVGKLNTLLRMWYDSPKPKMAKLEI